MVIGKQVVVIGKQVVVTSKLVKLVVIDIVVIVIVNHKVRNLIASFEIQFDHMASWWVDQIVVMVVATITSLIVLLN